MVADLSSQSDSAPDAIRVPRPFRFAAIISAAAILIATAGALFVPVPVGSVGITTLFFRSQDALCLLGVALLLIGLGAARFAARSIPGMPTILRHPRAAVGVLVPLVLICGIAGTKVAFHDYDLSRDEVQADFDATIFRSGMLIAPVEPEWRPYVAALGPRFMLRFEGGNGFVSGYLPVNAALRATVSVFGNPAWTSPLLAAVAVLAAFGVARRLWPDRPDAAVLSAFILATSSQVVITSMTSYAMTAHLALNLLWLWLFLRDDKIGHAGAIGVGFLATGLHQLIFHPLFVAPFIFRLWTRRRAWLANIYIATYGLILVFWIIYPQLALRLAGLKPDNSFHSMGAPFFLAHVLILLSNFSWAGTGIMLKEMLRFVIWENPILLPLLVCAYPAYRSNNGISRELTAGFVLTLLAMFILLPSQGLGWGYRYLHGLIGNCALLGGFGWISLANTSSRREMRNLGRLLSMSGVVAGFVLLGVHAEQAAEFIKPYARAHAAIAKASTDLVFVDAADFLFSEDLVRNDPFLRNKPKVMDLAHLNENEIAELCAHYSVSLFGSSQGQAVGILTGDRFYEFEDDVLQTNRAMLKRLSCGNELSVLTYNR